MRAEKSIVASDAGATFSRCRRWRYLLWRRWDAARPVTNFLMLNPSTADAKQLDPTCARARRYAEQWGFGALIVTNLFAWRSTDPQALRENDDPVGHDNDRAIMRAAYEADIVVCAWGNHGLHLQRATRTAAMLRDAGIDLHALRLNSSGQPAHPLYLPGALRPMRW